jgi:predicted O-methyltransferase YrrM
LKRWAANRRTIVELGVAEGVSALALREAIAENGTLYLIDPFHLSRIPALNFTKRVARRAVGSCARGNVVWIPKFSHDAAPGWNIPIDLLFIDGDHSDSGVERDWNDWSRFVNIGGVVIFHDARMFAEGWVHREYGPWKLVERRFRNGSTPNWKIVDEAHSMVVIERVQ